MAGFKRAVKHEAKLRLALTGPAGSGKTYTALAVATALADGRPVAVIDTERGSASKYADLFGFDVLELEPPYHPDRYIAAMREAQSAGYAVLVIDSLSHAWTGPGGLLEVHEQVVRRQTTKNSYTAWAEVTPIQTRFIDAITGSGLHIIATMRSKTAYVQGEGKNGRAEIRKVGTEAIQRDGMEFEFDVVIDMDADNNGVVGKTRCPMLASAVIARPGAGLAETLRDWLSGAPVPEPRDADMAPSNGNGHAAPPPTPASRPTPPAPAPAPAPIRPAIATSASSMSRAEFLAGARGLGLSPAQAMARLGVRSLDGLNLADALGRLGGAAPAPAATPASGGEDVEALRLRALDAGVTPDDWADVCQQEAGSADPARMTAADKVKLAAYVVKLERAHERALGYFHDEPDAGGPTAAREPVQGDAPDLRDLPTGAPGL